MELKYVNDSNRGVLHEGRSSGIAFGFCKKTDDTIKVVSPISTCKDYLSDQVYSERTGKPYYIYGFSSTKQDIFTNGEAFLAMEFVSTRFAAKLDISNPGVKKMIDSHKKIEGFIRSVEEKLQAHNPFPLRTKMEVVDKTTILIRFDEWWTKYCYLISLYALLVRIAYYDNLAECDDPLLALKDKNGDESYLMVPALPRLKQLTEALAPVQDLALIYPHDSGINGWWK